MRIIHGLELNMVRVQLTLINISFPRATTRQVSLPTVLWGCHATPPSPPYKRWLRDVTAYVCEWTDGTKTKQNETISVKFADFLLISKFPLRLDQTITATERLHEWKHSLISNEDPWFDDKLSLNLKINFFLRFHWGAVHQSFKNSCCTNSSWK